jgi:putative oxidoreductase
LQQAIHFQRNATRLSALGLLAMTAAIPFWVYPGAWSTHLTWA